MSDLISRQDAIDAIKYWWTYGGWQRLYDEVSNLPSAQQWIPCSERLPLDHDSVLITDYDYWIDIGYHDGQTWHYSEAVGTPQVIAWMPLPDPYKGEE